MPKNRKFHILLALGVATLVFATTSRTAHAQSCEHENQMYGNSSRNWSISIAGTMGNMIPATVNAGMATVTGGGPDRTGSCLGELPNIVAENGDSAPRLAETTANLGGCMPEDADDQQFCQNLVTVYREPGYGDPGASINGNTTALASAIDARASLLGIANQAGKLNNEPPPTNLAYFWNKQIEDVPFAGRAYAAEPTYSGLFLDITYELWLISRNVALGLLAIVGIVVGIMIMTRKRISAQATVTMQYALPRLIIGLILIVFSYAIGASMASFAWALQGSAASIVDAIARDTTTVNEAIVLSQYGVGLQAVLLIAVVFALGASPITAVVLVVTLVAMLILYIMAYIKLLIVYFKLILAIIISPFAFLMGSIPGHEDNTTNWFKKVVAYMLGILAIRVVINFTQIIATFIILEMGSNWQAGLIPFVGGIGVFVGSLIVSMVLIYGYNEARRVPDKIMNAIVGAPKRR